MIARGALCAGVRCGVTGRGALCAGVRFGVTGRWGALCAGVRFGVTDRGGAGESFGVVGRGRAGALSAVDGRLGVTARALEEEDGVGVEELSRKEELTVGRRKDGTGLSDAGGEGEAARAPAREEEEASELQGRGLDVGLVTLALRGLVPSRDRGVGRVAMGRFCCETKPKISSNHFNQKIGHGYHF